MTHAGALALTGPTGQEANIALLANDFLVFVNTGISPAAAVIWSEVREGLQLFLEAALSRATAGQTLEAAELEAADWTPLGRWTFSPAGVSATKRRPNFTGC